MKSRTALILTGILVAALVPASRADDLEAVEQKLEKAWAKHKSVSAKMTLNTHLAMGAMVMDGKGTGTLEMLNKDGKHYVRVEIENNVTQKMGEKENKLQQKQLIVSDGEYSYTVQELGERKMAIKSDIDDRVTGSPKGNLDEYRKHNTLKLLPEETIDGAKTYVIEATPKQAGPRGASKTVFYYQQDSGLMVKMVQFGPDNKPVTTLTYHDIKFDTDISPARFVFKAPEGVTVVDQTKKKDAKPIAKPPAKP